MNRRTLLQSLAVVPAVVQGMTRRSQAEAALRIAALEASHGGRLGVATLDLASGRRLTHRADERFPMCSTFKFLAAAYVLTRVDRGEERLDRRITFTAADLVTYSPVTETRVGQGMTVAELCDAAITLSDNTAGNLLLQSFGGPAGLTTYARSIGDMVTRLDRIEPTLNAATAGDPRDTTTAAAMVSNLQRIVLGNSLSAASRERIAEWLRANRTGDARLRAGFPKTWRIGDKTGSGAHGATNDIAVAWPPDRAPLLVAVYYAESTETADLRNAVLAEVARIVAAGSDVR
jgi:beta-lactamase class A